MTRDREEALIYEALSQVETPGSTASPASLSAFCEICPAFRMTESSRLVFSTIM